MTVLYCNNSTDCRIVALFANYSSISPGLSAISYITFQLIELLANSYSLTIFSLSLRHVFKVFHTNFTSIMLCYYAHGYLFTFTRIVLSTFQNGLVTLGESTTLSYQTMLVFSELRFYELFLGVFLFVALTMERLWATIYITDYVVNTRRHVSVLLISSAIVISHSSAYFTTRGIPFVPNIGTSCFVVLGFTMLIISLSILISLIIQLRNAKYERRLEEMNDLYGLSMKFQLRENFRAFRLLRRTTVVSGITTMCLCVDMSFVMVYQSNENLSSLLGAAFDTMQACSFAIFVSLGVFSQTSWRNAFAKKISFGRCQSMGFYSCNQYRNNSDCRFVALFANYSEISPGFSTHVYFALQAVELLTNIYSIVVFSLSVYHIFKSKIFHSNFISILLSFYVHTYLFTFTRIVLSTFQNGLIAVGGSDSFSYHTLIMFSELRFYGLFIAIYLFVALTIERVWATILIRNYEVVTRRYISVILISSAVVTAHLKGYFTPRGFPFVGSMTASCFIVIGFTMAVGFAASVSLINYHRNAVFERRLEESNDHYALSMKFQLRENFRAFRLLRRLAVTSVFFTTFMCVDLYFVIIHHDYKNLSSILGALFDAMQGCSLAIVISLAMFSQPSWRISFAEKIGLQQWISSESDDSISNPTNYAVMSDTYFNELGNSWDRRYDISANAKSSKKK